MATKINMDRYVWEGWTVGAFIRELAPQVEMIMSGQSWREPFRNKQELADWCRDNQPYYKKRIPEVNSYFARMYNLKYKQHYELSSRRYSLELLQQYV